MSLARCVSPACFRIESYMYPCKSAVGQRAFCAQLQRSLSLCFLDLVLHCSSRSGTLVLAAALRRPCMACSVHQVLLWSSRSLCTGATSNLRFRGSITATCRQVRYIAVAIATVLSTVLLARQDRLMTRVPAGWIHTRQYSWHRSPMRNCPCSLYLLRMTTQTRRLQSSAGASACTSARAAEVSQLDAVFGF